MLKLAGIAGMALALVLGVSALGIASAQDGTSTPSTGSPATSGTATPDTADDPLDVDTPATTDGAGGVGGETKAPASGTGTLAGGGDDVRTGLFFIALSVMSAGAAALLLGTQRKPTI